MKKILVIISVLLSSGYINAQSALTVSSDNENVKFTVFIDDVPTTDFYETWIRVTNIPEGFHLVKLVFEGDSVADYFKNIMFNAGTEKSFLVVEKKDLKKKVNKSGRNIGKKLEVGEHDESFNYLQDIYQLKLKEKTTYTGTGETELEVSTEKSIGTSILPITKEKK